MEYRCGKCEAILKNITVKRCNLCNSEDLKLVTYTTDEMASAREKLYQGYYDLINILKKYVDTTDDNYKMIAIWIIGTYFHKNFNTYPYLFFNAMRGSGKTRTLKLISALSAKGDGSVQNNLTEAVLFRIPKGQTTCIDEVEQIGNKEKQTLRELLNSAYKKGMKVKRMKKVHGINKETGQKEENQVTEIFEPYFPIVMANIWGVEEVLGDRSIVLVLEKSDKASIVMKVEDFDRNVTILALKRTFDAISDVSDVTLAEKNYIEEWNDYIDERYNITTSLTSQTSQNTTTSLNKKIDLEQFFNKVHDLGIFGRNFELIFPLLITAKLIDENVFNEFCEIASRIVKQKKEDEYTNSKDVSLYEFVDSISYEGLEYLSVKDTVRRFREFIDEGETDDRWLNDKWLGKAFKRLNLILDKKKTNKGSFVILNYNKAKEKLKIFKNQDEVKHE